MFFKKTEEEKKLKSQELQGRASPSSHFFADSDAKQ